LDPKVFSTNFSSNFFLVLDAKVFSSLKTFSFKNFFINFFFLLSKYFSYFFQKKLSKNDKKILEKENKKRSES